MQGIQYAYEPTPIDNYSQPEDWRAVIKQRRVEARAGPV